MWRHSQVGRDKNDSREGVVAAWHLTNNRPQFPDLAKAKFATEADGWLVAYAMVHGVAVVTQSLIGRIQRSSA